jgi:hypothetical protein
MLLYNCLFFLRYNHQTIIKNKNMNLVKTFDQYDDQCIFFCDPIKNNIMNEGNFIRILYSTNDVILNGVYLLVHLSDMVCEKYYNKYKCSFNISTHRDTIACLKTIEEDILAKYQTDKTPLFKIHEQISAGYIKLFVDIGTTTTHASFVLKISGIWETQYNYGLTYKFVKASSS